MTFPLPGPTYAECGCGCGEYGALKRAHRDGTRCVARKCKCKRCQGTKSRRSGLRNQSVARKKLGVAPSHKFGDANEENWHDPLFATEVKSGKQVGPVANWWARVAAQIDASQPDHGGQHKARRAVAMPEGWGKRGLVVVELDEWERLVAPALAQVYGEGSGR